MIHWQKSVNSFWRKEPTPAEQDVPVQASLLWTQWEVNEAVEIMTFHQQPAVICQDAVIRQEQCHFAARLRETPETQQLRELICAFIYHVYVQSNHAFIYKCLLCGCLGVYRMRVAVVVLLWVMQRGISDEDEDGSQDEGQKKLHVDEVASAVQLPEDGVGMERDLKRRWGL